MGEPAVLILISLGAAALAIACWRSARRAGGREGRPSDLSCERDLVAKFERKMDEMRALIERAEEAIRALEHRVQADGGAASSEDLKSAREARVPVDRERIAELHQDGMKVEAIAAKLGLPRGEVELIVSLERRR